MPLRRQAAARRLHAARDDRARRRQPPAPPAASTAPPDEGASTASPSPARLAAFYLTVTNERVRTDLLEANFRTAVNTFRHHVSARPFVQFYSALVSGNC